MKSNKEVGKREMFKAINTLYQDYKLPRIRISKEEWDIFFDITSSYFADDKQLTDYIIGVNIVIRRALNFALLDGAKEFTIDYLIKSLSDLTVCHIFLDQIKKMQEDIRNEIKNTKEKEFVKIKSTT